MDIMWGNKIVKVYDYGGFEDHHKKWEDVRVAIGPKNNSLHDFNDEL